MDRDKRKGDKLVSDNLDEMLNERQKLTLRQMEDFGWRLAFVRSPLFQEPLVVVCNAKGSRFVILEEDGRIDMEPNITLRSQVLSSLSQVEANAGK